MNRTVVNKAFYNVRENNGFLCHVYRKGIGCENCPGCVFNEAYGESMLTNVTNGALGGIKLPLTDNGVRKIDCREVISIGCLNLGERRDNRLINRVEGHIVGDNTGNFRRPTNKIATGFFRMRNLSQFGSVEHVDAFIYVTVNQKLEFVFYDDRKVERLTGIVEFQYVRTGLRGIDAGGYHRSLYGYLCRYSIFGSCDCNTAQIHWLAVRCNSVEITHIQLIADAVFVRSLATRVHCKHACNN